MKIILSTENSLTAMRLRDYIIKSVTGEIEGYNIFSARLLIRHASSGKMYLYDVLEIKKETGKSCQE